MIVILVVFSSHFDLPTYPLPPSSLPLPLPLPLPPPLPHLHISVPFRFGVLLISLPLRFHFGSISNLLPLHWNWLRFLRFAGFLSSQRMGIMIPGNLVVISRIPPHKESPKNPQKNLPTEREKRERRRRRRRRRRRKRKRKCRSKVKLQLPRDKLEDGTTPSSHPPPTHPCRDRDALPAGIRSRDLKRI